MTDPLENLEWSSLYSRYDAACRSFDAASIHLEAFEPQRPTTDRALYYQLVNSLNNAQVASAVDPIGVYEGVLYWKLYSQPAARSNISRWLRRDSSARSAAQERFSQLIETVPRPLAKDVEAVVETVRQLGEFSMPGIQTACALPMRTTLLHFLNPTVVPILDKMVLQAIGVHDKGANQKLEFLRDYLPFAWELADRYAEHAACFVQETPVRVIDMALWVSRGR